MTKTTIPVFILLQSILIACSEKKQIDEKNKDQQGIQIIDSIRPKLRGTSRLTLDTIPYEEMFDTIEADSIAVGDNNGNIYSGGSEESFLIAFGPAEKERVYSEMVDEMRTYYELDGLHAEFDPARNNRNLGVTKSTFKYRLGSQWYKPGDPIDMLAKQFPKSYKSKEGNRIFIAISLRGVPLDAGVAIFYDENGMITWLTSGANES